MNLTKPWSAMCLILFLVSCRPVTPAPPPAPQAAGPAQTAASWPGLEDGWSVIRSAPDLYAPAYDARGYLWAAATGRIYRWQVESGELTAFDSSDGLPANPGSPTVFEDQIWVTGSGGSVAVYSEGKWTTHKPGAENI